MGLHTIQLNVTGYEEELADFLQICMFLQNSVTDTKFVLDVYTDEDSALKFDIIKDDETIDFLSAEETTTLRELQKKRKRINLKLGED